MFGVFVISIRYLVPRVPLIRFVAIFQLKPVVYASDKFLFGERGHNYFFKI